MTDTNIAADPVPRMLNRSNGETIAYHFIPGKSPGVLFLTGFMSDMTGSKALCLEEFCREQGRAFLRFDFFGHGASSGSFTDGTIGRWADDAVAVLDRLTEGPQVLVGSSMGGWIMLLAALRRSERVAGMLGIAAAPDFTEDLLHEAFNDEQMAALERDGVVYMSSDYSPESTPFTRELIEDGRRCLLLRQEIPLDCPVRLIHGLRDPDVPWETSLRLSRMLRGDDVEISFVKSGEHRLSEPHDLARLTRTLAELLDRIENPPPRL